MIKFSRTERPARISRKRAEEKVYWLKTRPDFAIALVREGESSSNGSSGNDGTDDSGKEESDDDPSDGPGGAGVIALARSVAVNRRATTEETVINPEAGGVATKAMYRWIGRRGSLAR